MMRRALVVIFFIFGGVAPALADAASEGLIRDFVAWVDSSPEWSASLGDVRSRGSDTVAEGIVISRSDPNVSISIDELRLDGLAERQGGGFVADELEIGGLAIVSKELQYAVPAATVEALSVPSLSGVSFDPRRMMTFFAQTYSAMAQVEFRDFAIPEMVAVSEVAVPETDGTFASQAVYRNMTIHAMQGGVIERMAAGPLTMRFDGPEGVMELAAESAASDRMDVGAFAHVFDPAQYREGRGDRVWRPILSNITYSGISGSGPGGLSIALESVAIEDLDGRQLDEPFTQTWDKLMDLSIPEEAKPELVLEMLKSYRAWRLGRFNMHALNVEAPKESASFSLDDLTATGLSSDGVDSFTMSELRGVGPDGFVSVDALEVAGFASPDLEALIQFAALEEDVDAQMHAQAIRRTFAGLPRLEHFGLHQAAAGKSEADAVSLDSFTVDFRNWNEIFAEETELRMTGLDIPRHLLELEGEAAEMWDGLGYDDIVLAMSISDRWSPERGTDQATWTFAMRDAGELALSYTIRGVTEEWMIESTAAAARSEGSQAALTAMLDELSLEDARITVTDQSLLDRSFAVAAQKQGLKVSGAEYREQMRAALPFILSAALPPKIVKLLTTPLQEFLAGEQTLVAEIAPPTPLTLARLIAAADDVMALPERLNLKLRTEAVE